jgi:putative ATPase
MADLWQPRREAALKAVEPLAVRMRPRTLDEVSGQRHILGPGKLLRRMLDADRLTSIILHGPPGTGKTTLAEVIARHLSRHFERENASSVGVARIRQIIEEARSRLGDNGKRTVLFLDEIHRFSKSQQDVLLADVERGLITLIGATTENPLFAVNSALVSRSTLFRLESLSEEDVVEVLRRAVADPERGYGKMDLRVEEEALRVWAVKSDGDARRALTALEVAVLSSGKVAEWPSGKVSESSHSATSLVITRADAEESIQQKAAVYDGSGDQHYDAASAMIKSVRGSDPDAAMYWIAYMLEAGEDPRFIARRLAILASEDIGNADPRGIMVAAAAWELVERIGMPEARITLAQCATYLALAPKSNASYVAIDEAMADVREGRTIAVPRHIKDGNVRKAGDMSEGGVGIGNKGDKGGSYQYTHEAGIESKLLGKVGAQDYLGVEKHYYRPTEYGAEKMLKERLEEARRLRGGGNAKGT